LAYGAGMEPLTDEAMDDGLMALPDWVVAADRRSIVRELRFADFRTAFAFMAAVALEAEAIDHHPDWSNAYATVHVRLTTHAAGGLTELDLRLAAAIDRHAAAALTTAPRGA
jgi:4a-hydroxytetrahydrobiopterin dehydratase